MWKYNLEYFHEKLGTSEFVNDMANTDVQMFYHKCERSSPYNIYYVK